MAGQLDYYLWGAVKDKCYSDKPETIDTLKDNIREANGEIQLHTIDNVLKIWTNHVGYCMASQGSYLNEIIFHSINRRIVLSNKIEIWENIQQFFFKYFPKKRYLTDSVLKQTVVFVLNLKKKKNINSNSVKERKNPVFKPYF